MRALVIIITVLSGTAAASSTETLGQHHAWSRKFAEPAEPAITGSVGLRPDIKVQTDSSDCPRGVTRFDNLPFDLWRVVQCTGSVLTAEAPL